MKAMSRELSDHISGRHKTDTLIMSLFITLHNWHQEPRPAEKRDDAAILRQHYSFLFVFLHMFKWKSCIARFLVPSLLCTQLPIIRWPLGQPETNFHPFLQLPTALSIETANNREQAVAVKFSFDHFELFLTNCTYLVQSAASTKKSVIFADESSLQLR